MSEPTVLEAVAERDIDLLILEELAVCPEFLGWWLDQVRAQGGEGAEVVRVQHSVTHPKFGESDLVITYSLPQSEPHAVLIENKIDAPAQPDQALRYKQRGEGGVVAGTWKSYRTCIVAPQRYLDAIGHANLYDAQISYEAVRAWFLSRAADARAGFRAKILAEAIEQIVAAVTRPKRTSG